MEDTRPRAPDAAGKGEAVSHVDELLDLPVSQADAVDKLPKATRIPTHMGWRDLRVVQAPTSFDCASSTS